MYNAVSTYCALVVLSMLLSLCIGCEPRTGLFMDLETEARPRFLNHEGLGAWFLTDLENGMFIQLSQTAKPKDYICSVACVV